MSICMAVRCFFANHCRIAANTKINTIKHRKLLNQVNRLTSSNYTQKYLCVCASTSSASKKMSFDYPEARRDESVVDDYHGVKIKDPYRWLEDPDSNETKEFIEAENKITRPYLDACPVKADINERLTELWNYPKYSCPFRRGDRYFFFKNTGLQNQNVLYVQDSLDGEPRVFLDPNTLSEDGTIALSGSRFTEDGNTFAYGLSASGSDWITIHLKDVATGKDYPEVLEKVKFASMSWTKDNKGLFYSRYPEQTGKTDGSETEVNRDQKLCYHRLDTPQSEDVVTVEFPEEPLWRIGAEVTDCGRYLIVSPVKDCRDNLLFFADLSKSPAISGLLPLTQIVHKFEADFEYVTNEGSVCIFRTNKNAPNYRLIKIDLDNPAEENWETLLPEHPSDVLDWASAVDNDKLVIHYVRDVKSVLQLHWTASGALLQEFPLGVGSVVGFSGKKQQAEVFYHFMSFLSPGIIYHVNFAQKEVPYKPTVFREVTVKGFDASQYEAKQIFYSSKDGTKVPMFLVSKKGLPRDGSTPALVYGYGGFNINIQPSFSVTRLVFMQHFNGIVAIPNIRGGGQCQVRVMCDDQITAHQLSGNGLITIGHGCIIKTEKFTIYPHRYHTSEIRVSPDLYSPTLAPINNIINLTIPHHNKSEPSTTLLAEAIEVGNNIKAVKSKEQDFTVASESVSFHDIHHYVMIYMVMTVIVIAGIVWIIRRMPCRRKVSISTPEPTAQSDAREPSPMMKARLRPAPAPCSTPSVTEPQRVDRDTSPPPRRAFTEQAQRTRLH